MAKNSWIPDVVVLIARVVVGVVFTAHGAQKLFTYGVSGTADSFEAMRVPAPQAAALVAGVVELVGGIALIVGAATLVAGILLALDMLGAFILVHAGNGLFMETNGYELVAALGGAALLLAALGARRISIDGAVAARRRPVRPTAAAPVA